MSPGRVTGGQRGLPGPSQLEVPTVNSLQIKLLTRTEKVSSFGSRNGKQTSYLQEIGLGGAVHCAICGIGEEIGKQDNRLSDSPGG